MQFLSAGMTIADWFGGGETQAAATQTAGASPYHVAWDKWFSFYTWEIAVESLGTLLLILLLGAILTRIFRRQLERHKLKRPTNWAIVACHFYFGIVALHPYLMVDEYDILTLIIHKSFAAIMLIVAIRYLDRLIILPVLTRLSKTAPSRFVHQIIIAVLAFFVFAGYCSWAFHFEIGSLLAGSAVVSIVIGLALQETLGNFFSGMVLQASVPFQPGDWIQIGEMEGRVVEMTWRAVTLLTGANNYVLIPNSTVAKEKIVNYHSPSAATAVSIAIGLDYDLPPNDAKRVLIRAAKDVPGVLSTPGPSVALASFDDSAILYKVVFWIDEPNKHGGIEEAVRTNAWYRLNEAGYGIPFPMRTVELTNTTEKQAEIAAASRAVRLAAIQKNPLFSDLPPELQEKLAAGTRAFSLAAGQTFYRQNDPGNSLFILETGAVTTFIHTGEPAPAGQDLDAGDMSAPALFGEVSALTSQPRGATIRAKTDVRAIEVDQHHLQDLFTHDPALMNLFSKIVAERQAYREEVLKKLGAAETADRQHAEPDSVLDRMKRLFNRHIR